MWTTHDIPALPVAQARALALLSHRDVEVEAIAEVVESDPALTACLLRAANSVVSAPVHQITTAREAIVRIGLDPTFNVVSGAIVRRAFGDLRRAALDTRELWRHLIAVALLADAAAASQGARTGAFTAGLLHDLGRLSMAVQEPRRYAAVARLVRGGADPVEAEVRLLGISHTRWGERVAHAWGIPEAEAEAIGDHHGGEKSPLSAAVRDARQIAATLGIGDGLCAPSVPTEEETPADTVLSFGGPEALFLLIDWYGGAFQVAA